MEHAEGEAGRRVRARRELPDRCASVSSVLVFGQDLRDLLHLAGEGRGLLAEHGRDRLAGIPGPLGGD